MDYKLLIPSIIKVITCYYIFKLESVSFYMKILYFYFVDTILDCTVPIFLHGKHPINDKLCQSCEYLFIDKISDTICYIFLLNYIYNSKEIDKKYIIVLLYLFLFRLLGTIISLQKREKRVLSFFPNFFLEMSVLFYILTHYKIVNKYKIWLILLVIVLKVFQEYLMHYKNLTLEDIINIISI